MNINKTIHEAMGLCWHECFNPVEGNVTFCSKCDWKEALELTPPVDYTDPIHYCASMDWMRKDHRADELICYCLNNPATEPCNIAEWLSCDRQEQITLIAEAIEAGVLT